MGPCGDLASPQEGSVAAAPLWSEYFLLKVWKPASLACLGLKSDEDNEGVGEERNTRNGPGTSPTATCLHSSSTFEGLGRLGGLSLGLQAPQFLEQCRVARQM